VVFGCPLLRYWIDSCRTEGQPLKVRSGSFQTKAHQPDCREDSTVLVADDESGFTTALFRQLCTASCPRSQMFLGEYHEPLFGPRKWKPRSCGGSPLMFWSGIYPTGSAGAIRIVPIFTPKCRVTRACRSVRCKQRNIRPDKNNCPVTTSQASSSEKGFVIANLHISASRSRSWPANGSRSRNPSS
jgi:hypothetical protein